MMEMFSGAAAFNSDLSKWDTNNVALLMGSSSMFNGATAFDKERWNKSRTFYWHLSVLVSAYVKAFLVLICCLAIVAGVILGKRGGRGGGRWG